MAQQLVLENTIFGVCQGKPWAHVTNFTARSANPAVTTQAVDNFNSGWYSTWKANILPLLSTSLSVKSCSTTALGITYTDPNPPHHVKFSVNYMTPPIVVNDPGAITGDPMPTFNAIYGRTRTVSGLRRYRGSIHLPGLGENQSTGQFLFPASLAVLQSKATAQYIADYIVTVGADSWTFRYGVLSKKYCLLNGPGSAPWDYCQDAVAVTISPRVGSLTRRKTRDLP